MTAHRTVQVLLDLSKDEKLTDPLRSLLRQCAEHAGRIPAPTMRELAVLALDCWKGCTPPEDVVRAALGALRTAASRTSRSEDGVDPGQRRLLEGVGPWLGSGRPR